MAERDHSVEVRERRRYNARRNAIMVPQRYSSLRDVIEVPRRRPGSCRHAIVRVCRKSAAEGWNRRHLSYPGDLLSSNSAEDVRPSISVPIFIFLIYMAGVCRMPRKAVGKSQRRHPPAVSRVLYAMRHDCYLVAKVGGEWHGEQPAAYECFSAAMRVRYARLFRSSRLDRPR